MYAINIRPSLINVKTIVLTFERYNFLISILFQLFNTGVTPIVRETIINFIMVQSATLHNYYSNVRHTNNTLQMTVKYIITPKIARIFRVFFFNAYPRRIRDMNEKTQQRKAKQMSLSRNKLAFGVESPVMRMRHMRSIIHPAHRSPSSYYK